LVGALLNATPTDDQCATAAFVGDPSSYQVICKSGPNTVVLRGSNKTVRAYRLGKSQLEITTYTPITTVPTCAGNSKVSDTYVKETKIVAWGDALQAANLRRSYAALFGKYLNADKRPQELMTQLTKPGSDSKRTSALPESVSVSFPVYDYMMNQIQGG